METKKQVKLAGKTNEVISHFGIPNNTGIRNHELEKELFILFGKMKSDGVWHEEVLGVFNNLKKARSVAKEFLDIPVKSLPKIKRDILNGDSFNLHTKRGVRGCSFFDHRSARIEFVNVNEEIEQG